MTREVFARYQELVQKQETLSEQLLAADDEELEAELAKVNHVLYNLVNEYDWQDAMFDNEEGLFGLKDVVGNVLISPQWDDIYPELSYQDHQHMPYTVCKEGKWGIMMADGKDKLLCDLEYDSIEVVGDQEYGYRDYFVICKDDKYGIMDFHGKELLPCTMDNITPGFGQSVIEHEGKCGMVTYNGDVIMPEYDIIEFETNDLMLPAQKDGKWGHLDVTSGEFTVKESMSLGEVIASTTVCGISVEECVAKNEDGDPKTCFRLKEPLTTILERVDRVEYLFLEDYVDQLLEAEIASKSQSATISLAGHVIPSGRDAADKTNLPTTSPLFHEDLKHWQDTIAISKCFDKLFDWSMSKPRTTRYSSWKEELGDAIIFPKDDIPGYDGQWAYIKDGKWGVREWSGQESYGYDELRGVYPGRLCGRKGDKWEHIVSGWIGQSRDSRYFYGFLRLWDYLDTLLGNRDGHYVASEIEKLCKDKTDIVYTPRNYDIIDRLTVDDVTVLKVKNDFMTELANDEDKRDYYYMLEAPLMEVLRKKKDLDLDLSSLDEYCDITRPVFSMEKQCSEDVKMHVRRPTLLLPHPEDVSLYFHAIHEKQDDGLGGELQRFYMEHYNFNDKQIVHSGKKGLCDCLGHVVVDPIYEEATPGVGCDRIPRGAEVKENSKVAFALSSMPKPVKWYDDIDYLFGIGCVVIKNGKKGIVDDFLDEVVPCELDEVYRPDQGCTLIKKDGLWGLVCVGDDGDKFIYVKPQFEDWKGHYRFMVKKDDEWWYINEFGECTSNIDEAYNFWPLSGPAWCFVTPMDEIKGIERPHTDTIYDELTVEKGKLIPHTKEVDDFIRQYELKLEEFTSSQIAEYFTLEDQIHAFKKHIDYSSPIFEEEGKFGLKDLEGNVVVKPLYDEIRKNSTRPWAPTTPLSVRKGDKWALVDQLNGEELTPFQYDSIDYLGMFNGFMATRDGEKIHLDHEGKEDGEGPVVINDIM